MTIPHAEPGLPKHEFAHPSPRIDTQEYLAEEPVTVAEFLRQPVIAEYYPWEVNPFSPTPFGRERIKGKGYFFPALRYQIRRLEKNTAKNQALIMLLPLPWRSSIMHTPRLAGIATKQ